MAENENFGYEGCTLTVKTSDVDNKVTFAPFAKDEKQIDIPVQDVNPDPGLIYALAVAAAGRHHVLVYGQPLKGRDFITAKITQFMPNLMAEEQLSVNRIYSIAGLLKPNQKIIQRPFRMPHPTASIEGMCGGGAQCLPGEVSFAHNGVLFLKDTLEFKTSVLQMLNVPMRNGNISLSRAGRTTVYPADLQLVMTTNPCPCGNHGSSDKICLCSMDSIRQYWKKLPAALTEMVGIRYNTDNKIAPMFYGFDDLRARVKNAVKKQLDRQGKFNQQLTDDEVNNLQITSMANASLESATIRYGFSAKEVLSIKRVARTILDMKDGNWTEIGLPSMSYAISLHATFPEAIR